MAAVAAAAIAGVIAAPAPAAQRIVYPVAVTPTGDAYDKRSLRGATRAVLVGYARSSVDLAAVRRSGHAGMSLISPEGRALRVPGMRVRGAASTRDRGIVLTTRRPATGRARPDTWITSGPVEGRTRSSSRARFAFGTDRGTRFACALDDERFRTCRSPVSYSDLAPGEHRFRVRAAGRRGSDRSPARRTWKVAAVAEVAPAPVAGLGFGQLRPYDERSPWNTPIPAGVAVSANSRRYVDAIAGSGLPLTSDPDQYALPVYAFDARTPRRTVRFSGSFSSYDHGDDSRVSAGYGATVTDVPIPDGALESAGSDGQIVFWDPESGVEWSFWQFERAGDGTYRATNGVRYRTTAGNFGRFADGKAGRGAGTPYLAGLVRPWEIAQGRIDHALAFAYDSPSSEIVYPASKSDGGGVAGTDAPEGTRLQLDPTLTEADFEAWGLAPEAKVIARALQRYGMYVIDNSGSSKIYLEDRLTARWHAGITRNLTAKIPLTRFRAVAPPAPQG